MPLRLGKIALRVLQRPALPRTEGVNEVLRLRGPPGHPKHRSNRRTQHPSGVGQFSARNGSIFDEKQHTQPISIIRDGPETHWRLSTDRADHQESSRSDASPICPSIGNPRFLSPLCERSCSPRVDPRTLSQHEHQHRDWALFPDQARRRKTPPLWGLHPSRTTKACAEILAGAIHDL